MIGRRVVRPKQDQTMSTDRPPSSTDRWELITNGNFLLLWGAYGISALGDHLSEMAILKTQDVVARDVDVTPLNARMMFMFFLPFFALAPLAGVLADRFPRRALMIAADLARCVILVFFVTLIGWTQQAGTWGPFLPLLLVGAFAAVFSPARSALLPTLVRPDQLVRANGMMAGLGIIGTMGAAVLGGHLAEYYAPTVAFRVNAGTFLCSAVLLAFLRPPRQGLVSAGAAQRSPASLGDLAAGFSYVRRHHRVLELIAIASLVWFFGMLVYSVIPAVVRDVYGGSYQEMSYYRAFWGLGFILGAAAVSILGDALRPEVAITWGFFGVAVGISVFAASVFLPFEPLSLSTLGAVGIVLSGLFGVAILTSYNALLQRIVPNRYRGRIFGIACLSTTGAVLVATGLLGVPQWAGVDRWVGWILLGVAGAAAVVAGTTLGVRAKRYVFGPWIMFLSHVNEFIARFWWGMRRIGRPTVLRNGPVIIVSNHVSPVDPLILLAAAPYRLFGFLVAEEFTHWPLIRSLMKLIGCIPVRRQDHDTGATKQALRHLQAGKALGIFIEGRIVPPGEQVRPKDGVAMLALRAGAVVVPAHISGARYRPGIWRGVFGRHDIRIRFGHPVPLDDLRSPRPPREAVRTATARICQAIERLAPCPARQPACAEPRRK